MHMRAMARFPRGSRRTDGANRTVRQVARPEDFPLGSTESRAYARAVLESRKKKGMIIRVNVVYIGHDGSPLPPTTRHEWDGGVAEIVHTADGPL